MDRQKKPYERPEIIEYGLLTEQTLGSSGPHLDFSFSGSQLTISNDCPKTQIVCVS